MAAPVEIPLWNGNPPGTPDAPDSDVAIPSNGDDPGTYEKVGRPSLFAYPSGLKHAPALLLYPGGGFQHIAIGKGTGDIARQLNAAGVSVFVFKYRLPTGRWAAGPDCVLQDGQRALRLIRHNAKAFDLDPAKIGVIGFSAGGFGAATMATRFAEPSYPSADAIDSESARPDFAALLFPVIALDRPFAHQPSRRALLGTDDTPESGAKYSPDRHVPTNAPPVFIGHGADDTVVPIENAVAMYKALMAAHIAVEFHAFQTGGHGLKYGTGPGWMKLLLAWARNRGFIQDQAG